MKDREAQSGASGNMLDKTSAGIRTLHYQIVVAMNFL